MEFNQLRTRVESKAFQESKDKREKLFRHLNLLVARAKEITCLSCFPVERKSATKDLLLSWKEGLGILLCSSAYFFLFVSKVLFLSASGKEKENKTHNFLTDKQNCGVNKLCVQCKPINKQEIKFCCKNIFRYFSLRKIFAPNIQKIVYMNQSIGSIREERN